MAGSWQKNLFYDYTTHSSIHGMSYLTEPNRSCAERSWWIIALFASVYGCGKFIFDAWQINPIIISFTGKPTPIWQVPFPAVTICPTIQTDSQNLRNILRKYYYGQIPLDRVTEEERQQLLALNPVCPSALRFVNQQNYTKCTGCLESLRRIIILMERVIMECKFKGQVINCSDHVHPIATWKGVCYTFNGLDVFRRRKDKESNSENISWTIDQGYTPTATSEAYPQRAMSIGAKSGLSVLLGYKKSALEPLCNAPPGFWVVYQMQHENPRLTSGYLMVAMGNAITVIVDPKLMTSSKALQSYSLRDRKCYFSDERQLEYFEKYTKINCEAE